MLTCSTRADGPRFHIIRIRPDQITESTLMRNLLSPSHHAHLIQCPNLGTESTVYTQHLAVDDGAQRHEIEDLAAGFPHRGTAIFLETLFVETVDLGDLAGFMVTADQRNSVWISRSSAH